MLRMKFMLSGTIALLLAQPQKTRTSYFDPAIPVGADY